MSDKNLVNVLNSSSNFDARVVQTVRNLKNLPPSRYSDNENNSDGFSSNKGSDKSKDEYEYI
jgi:hypothetical protein